jgi:hypothetical protein
MPAVAEAKGGGSWRDSPLAEGRTLAYRQFGNIIDSFQILVDGPTQDVVAREVEKLRFLLESAVKYWVSRQPGEYVYLVARAQNETNARYAIIVDYRTPSDADPYTDPFGKLTSHRAAFDPWTLTLEHSHWLENIPGTGTCVQLSGQQLDWNPYTDWPVDTVGPVSNVNAMVDGYGASRYVFGGDTGQIWRSTAATVWAAIALAHANCLIYAMSQTDGGAVYASGYDSGGVTGYTYWTADDGATWNTYGAGTNRGTNARASLFMAADGNLYLATGSTLGVPALLSTIPASDAWVVAESSAQWAEVLCCSEFPSTSEYAPNRMILSVYDTLGSGVIYISDDYWTTVEKAFELPGVRFISMFVTALGTIIAGTDTNAIYSSTDGITWEIVADNLLGPVYGFVRDNLSGEHVCCAAGGRVWHSDDEGMTWDYQDVVDTAYATIYSVAISRRSASGLVVGRAGDIYYAGYERDLGYPATCDDKIFVVNHRSELNLTNIMIYDAAPVGYTEQMRVNVFFWPIDLLPGAPAIGDACYFGIDTAMQTNGDPTFDNIVFNISTPAYDLSLRWEYYNGTAWTTLTVADRTDAGGGPFTREGINSVSWEPPVDWATVAVNTVTALWVRCYVYAVGGAPVEPEQQIPLPYTCIWPRTDIAAAQVPGTIMALARHRLTMRSDEDGTGDDAPDLYANRVLMGLRSIERGGIDCADFTAYLNCSDEQNPPGILCETGASASFVNYLDHATGRAISYSPPGTQSMAMRARFTLAGELARQYYGSYRVFARIRLVNGDLGTITLRFYVSSPFGSDEYWSNIKTIPDTEGLTKLIDFGEITLPLARVLRPTEYPGPTRLEIHAASTSVSVTVSHMLDRWMSSRILAPYDTGLESSVNPTDLSHWTTAQLPFDSVIGYAESAQLYLLDLILLPTDEWYGDFVDDILSSTTAFQQGYQFDLDSIQNPRERQRPLVINAATGAVMTVYEPQSPGPALLNPQKQQRMWYLFDKSNTTATADWDSSAHILVSARAERMARYLGMRGDQ